MSRPLPLRGEPALPPWIRERKVTLAGLHELKKLMRTRGLHTVCEEARCPNRSECFERKTATFLVCGDVFESANPPASALSGSSAVPPATIPVTVPNSPDTATTLPPANGPLSGAMA